MSEDRDFYTVTFKVNVSGSWAHLLVCPVDRLDAVKAACETLAATHRGSIKFKYVDEAGGTIEAYSRTRFGACQWHEPMRGS